MNSHEESMGKKDGSNCLQLLHVQSFTEMGWENASEKEAITSRYHCYSMR